MNTILFLRGNHSTLLKGVEPASIEPLLRAARRDGVDFVAVDNPEAAGGLVWVDPLAVVGIVGADPRQAAVRAVAGQDPSPPPRPLPVGSAVALS